MVRKWSYIKNLNLPQISPHQSLFFGLKSNFKIFRSTTRFRKSSVGKSCLLTRKLNFRLHRRTSLSAFSTIGTAWARIFLAVRRPLRFLQNYRLLQVGIYATNSNLHLYIAQKNYNLRRILFSQLGLSLLTLPARLLPKIQYFNVPKYVSASTPIPARAPFTLIQLSSLNAGITHFPSTTNNSNPIPITQKKNLNELELHFFQKMALISIDNPRLWYSYYFF